MSQPKDIKPIIENLLQSTTAKDAKADIKSYAERDPNGFTLSLLATIKGDYEFSIRMEALKVLEKYYGANKDHGWNKINEETASQLFSSLFEIFEKTPEKADSKQQYYRAIGKIGAQIILNLDDDDESIPDSGKQGDQFDTGVISKYFLGTNEEFQFGALAVMSECFLYHTERYKPLDLGWESTFEHLFTKENDFLKDQVVQAVVSYWYSAEITKKIPFQSILDKMFGFYEGLFGKNDELVLKFFGCLEDVLSSNTKVLKNKLKEIYNLAKKYSDSEDAKVKEDAQSLLMKLIETYPKKTLKYLNELLKTIFEQLEDGIDDLDDEWEKQVNQDDDFSDEIFNNQLGLLNEICAVSPDECFDFFTKKLKPQLERASSWKKLAATLMGLSQIGEFYETNQLSPFTKVAFKETQNENAKVRYAAYHYIAQVSDDLKEEMTSTYFDQFITTFKKGITDTSDKVLSHAVAAGTNFFGRSPKEKLAPYISQLLQSLLQFIETKPTAVKEEALSCISTIIEAAGDCFKPFWKQISELVFALLKNAVAPELKILRGRAIECLTMIGISIGKEEFQQAVPNIIAEMDKVQKQLTYANDADHLHYVLSGWQRISIVLEKDIQKYEEAVKNAILVACSTINEIDKLKATYLESEGEEVKKLYEMDQHLQIAQLCMKNFITQGPKLVKDEEVLQKIIETNFLVYESQFTAGKDQAGKISPKLVKAVILELNDSEKQVTICKGQLEKMFSFIETEFEIKKMIEMADCILDVFESMAGIALSETDVGEYSARLKSIMQQSKERFDQNIKYGNEENEDEDEADEQELIKEDNAKEETLQVKVVEIYSALVSVNKEIGASFAKSFYQEYLQKLIQKGNDIAQKEKVQVLFFIDNMVEKLGYEHFKSQWEQFATIIFSCINDKDSQIKQAAVYGVGEYARNTPKQLFKEQAKQVLDSLIKAYFTPQGYNWSLNEYQFTRDNILSSVGKILVHQKENVENYKETYTQLVNFLPLKKDKVEAKRLHTDVYILAMTYEDEILSEATVKQLIVLASQLSGLKKDWFDSDIKNAIQQFIDKFRYSEKYGETLIKAISSLPEGNLIKEMCPTDD